MKAPAGGEHRFTHLPALLVAWAVIAVGILGVWTRARQLELRAAAGELVLPGALTNRGLAIQRAVLDRNDAYLLFGSSEIVRSSAFRAMEFYRSSPTGFRVVGIGDRGTPLAVTAYDLAALGKALRNRKVAISVSHNFFHNEEDSVVALRTYLGTFSLLHASRITFGGELDSELQRRIAQRLLRQPAALEREPLIRTALHWRADGSRLAPLVIAALAPLGKAQSAMLELQDHVRTVRALSRAQELQKGPPVAVPIDWAVLSDSAERLYRPVASSNPFGMVDHWWASFDEYLLSRGGSRNDREWQQSVLTTRAWEDLDLLLDVVTTSGGQLLLLSMPYKGVFRDFEGTTPAGRRVYYDSLRAHAARAGVSLRDFAEFEGDRWFMRDQSAHLSPKGWVHYDQAIEEFVHQAAP